MFDDIMTAHGPARILIVDDDRDLTAMLKAYLEGEGFTVSVVHSGEEALSEVTADEYDAIILDVMLPGISGSEVLRRIRLSSNVAVIMLTANGDRVSRASGLENGADDYVPKPYFPRELVARLRAVLRRHDSRHYEMGRTRFKVGNLDVDSDRRMVTCNSESLDLTGSEFALTMAFVRAAGAVLSKDDLSQQVLHRPLQPYDRSIDMHVSNLRQKLARSGGPPIETIRGVGYRMPDKQ